MRLAPIDAARGGRKPRDKKKKEREKVGVNSFPGNFSERGKKGGSSA